MSAAASKFRRPWVVALLAPMAALGVLTLIGSPTEAVCPPATPQIQAAATVPQGGVFTVRGRGMDPSDYVSVYIGARNLQHVGTSDTDSCGRFDDWYYLPPGTPVGTQVITVFESGLSLSYDERYTTTIRVVRGGGALSVY